MPRWILLGVWLAVTSIGLMPSGADASGGAIELNQTCATATGCGAGDTAGFPITTSGRGRYVLTSNLVVSGSADGVHLPDGAALDFAGFEISGPVSCPLGSCPPSTTGSGIVGGSDVALENGRVRGFGEDCVALGTGGKVERMQISQCARHGIRTGSGSVVARNQIREVGGNGIEFYLPVLAAYLPSLYERNAIGTTGAASVVDGKPSAPNSCTDRLCGATGQRLYYLTSATHSGSGAAQACAAGFHLAAYTELANPTALEYDSTRGVAGVGEGPTASIEGWARFYANLNVDCADWTSTSGFGLTLKLSTGTTTIATTQPWILTERICSSPLRVWCAQD